jgi:hypothetical protein
MRHADEVKQRAEVLREKRVRERYADLLEKLEKSIEDDINSDCPAGYVSVWLPTKELVAAADARRTPDLNWYLGRFGYRVSNGIHNVIERRAELIVSWNV